MNQDFDLHLAMQALRQRLAAGMRENWRRDLPFGELLSDRFSRAASLGFGENASIYEASYVYGDVRVGEGTWVGPFTILDGTGGLTIGRHCSISAGVQIYTHDSVKWALSGGTAEYERAPVSIGNACYVGPTSVIAKGVTIGDHVLVAAGSLVTRDVAPLTIVGGTPAKPIGRVVFEDGAVRLEYGATP